jgi:phage terminase large subunit-like protein
MAGIGRDLPRLETAVPELADSDADAIGEWAKRFLGVTLMPWQRRVLHGMTVKSADGELQHRAALVSTARQQGKTVALTALVGYWLTIRPLTHGPQTVVTTAHRLDVAVELFHRLADILETHFGAKVLRAYGRNAVEMPDGSRWLVKAATGSVGHGLSVDLVVCDEVWSISAEAIDQGLLPTMRARPDPLLAMWSTAGTEASEVMLRYRDQGIQLIDSGKAGDLYFAEWSPAPDMDPMSPAAWAYANPALGRTLKLKTLEAESRSPDRAAFLRAAVNLWVATERGWLTPGLWPELRLPDGVELPPGGVVALEQSLDESRYYGLRAVPLGDGRTAVTVEFQAGTIADWIANVERLAVDPRIRFAVTPTLDIHYPAHLVGRRTSVGYRELLAWTPTVRQMLEQKRVAHTGEQLLAEHVQRAVAVRTQSSVALSSQRSPGPIELARCMVWAVALTSKTVVSGKPMIVVAGG